MILPEVGFCGFFMRLCGFKLARFLTVFGFCCFEVFSIAQQVYRSKTSGLRIEILFLKIQSDVLASANLNSAVYYNSEPQMFGGSLENVYWTKLVHNFIDLHVPIVTDNVVYIYPGTRPIVINSCIFSYVAPF